MKHQAQSEKGERRTPGPQQSRSLRLQQKGSPGPPSQGVEITAIMKGLPLERRQSVKGREQAGGLFQIHMTFRLIVGGDPDHQAVQRLSQLDLTTESTVLPALIDKLECVLLRLAGRPDPVHPGGVNVDMTGGAGTDPAAIRVDAFDAVGDGRLHQSSSGFLDDHLLVVRGDECYFRHGTGALPDRGHFGTRLDKAGFGPVANRNISHSIDDAKRSIYAMGYQNWYFIDTFSRSRPVLSTMRPQIERILPFEQSSFLSRRFRQKQFDHPFHFHPEIEVTLVVRGNGTRIAGDHVANFEAGDLCLIGESLPHIYRTASPLTACAEAEVLHFRRSCGGGFIDSLAELGEFSALLDTARRGLRFPASTAAAVLPLLKQIREVSGTRRLLHLVELFERLAGDPEAATLASPGYTGVIDQPYSDRMRRACEEILSRFDEELSLGALAGISHLSPAHFSRAFKRTTRKTFSEFLTEVRLGHACRLLIESDLPIAEIAFGCGFRNLSSFNRRFRQFYACTPRDYRNRCREAAA